MQKPGSTSLEKNPESMEKLKCVWNMDRGSLVYRLHEEKEIRQLKTTESKRRQENT